MGADGNIGVGYQDLDISAKCSLSDGYLMQGWAFKHGMEADRWWIPIQKQQMTEGERLLLLRTWLRKGRIASWDKVVIAFRDKKLCKRVYGRRGRSGLVRSDRDRARFFWRPAADRDRLRRVERVVDF
ncbi:plant invertase/pectin methylesterase inhibitor [Striga asiatica]|uniref:Plant invertase/pectin methylesterase inhibitor n=1 Tax=Striga asiatica TaxID=4170 RepID=A0A5A7R241_STRAF|nr:plant invertase/pectin methylesterase inhibitor [Striga asiatica]